MKTPKLVIFDMDGLMLDTETLAIAGWHAAACELNIAITDELLKSVIGLTRELCKTYMFETLGHEFDYDKALDIIHDNVDKHFNEHGVPLKPGLIQLLDKLEKMGIKKAVATSTAYDRAVYKLTLAGISHRFHTIIGGNMVANSKPAPDIFLKAAEICGTASADCIVLEDSNPGAEGAARAGMRVIVVPDLVPPSDITRKRAYAICDSLHDAQEIIFKDGK